MINPPLPYTPHHSSRALTKPNLSHFQHKCMSLSIFFSCKIRISLDCFTTSIILLRDSLSLSCPLCMPCPYWFTFPYNTSMLYRGVTPNHALFHLTAHSNPSARYVVQISHVFFPKNTCAIAISIR